MQELFPHVVPGMLLVDAPALAPGAGPGKPYRVMVLCVSRVPALHMVNIREPLHLTSAVMEALQEAGHVKDVKFDCLIPTIDV